MAIKKNSKVNVTLTFGQLLWLMGELDPQYDIPQSSHRWRIFNELGAAEHRVYRAQEDQRKLTESNQGSDLPL